MRYRLYVLMVNELSLVGDIFVQKLALGGFTFLYIKRSENETIQVSGKGTNELFFLIVFLLHCSGIRDKKFFSNIFFVKIEISKKLIFNLYY